MVQPDEVRVLALLVLGVVPRDERVVIREDSHAELLLFFTVVRLAVLQSPLVEDVSDGLNLRLRLVTQRRFELGDLGGGGVAQLLEVEGV